jgi:cell division inhibitor SulA
MSMDNAFEGMPEPAVRRHREQLPDEPDAGSPGGAGVNALEAVLPDGRLPSAALAELRHDSHGEASVEAMLAVLARLDRRGRWIVLLAPPGLPRHRTLSRLGIDPAQVLIVQPRGQEQALTAAEKALAYGRCAAVAIWPRRVDADSMARLRRAAIRGGSLALLWRRGAGDGTRPVLNLNPASAGSLTIMLPAPDSDGPAVRSRREAAPASRGTDTRSLAEGSRKRAHPAGRGHRSSPQLDLILPPACGSRLTPLRPTGQRPGRRR